VEAELQSVVAAASGSANSVQALDGAADPFGIYPSPGSGGVSAPALVVFGTVGVAAFKLISAAEGAPDLNDIDLTKAIDAINQKIADDISNNSVKEVPNSSGLWLVGAAPDLVNLGGSQGNLIGGSPDVPPQEASTNAMWRRPPTSPGPSAPGPSAQVYVLDTAAQLAPHVCVTYTGATTTPSTAPSSPGCDLLNLTEDQLFTLPESLYSERYGYSSYTSITPPYPAITPSGYVVPTDLSFEQHGQFIATIIQHQAPGADVRLIRVLNNFGASDVRSLIYGLHEVYTLTNGSATHTVVNMSLAVEPPTACLSTIWDGARNGQSQYAPNGLLKGCPSNLESSDLTGLLHSRLYLPLGLVIEKMVALHYPLVAAAGNDSGGGQCVATCGPDMPGSFCGAISVGATADPQNPIVQRPTTMQLEKTYSNDPNSECLAISVGFDRNEVPDTLTTQTPVASAPAVEAGYAYGGSDEPDHARICSLDLELSGNGAYKYTNAMAGWKGTSFATAFVSAYLANQYTNAPSTSGDAPCG
jgi:hypothetical protein